MIIACLLRKSEFIFDINSLLPLIETIGCAHIQKDMRAQAHIAAIKGIALVKNRYDRAAWNGCLVVGCLLGGLTLPASRAIAQVKGAWTAVIPMPNIPVAAALLPTGKVLTWSSNNEFTFEGDIGTARSQTQTALFDPVTQTSTLRIVTNTLSDMFCPGTAMLSDGRLLVNGGSSSPSANIYDSSTDAWSAAAPMNIARGYNSDVTLADGSVMTLGGSWSGGAQEKLGEVLSVDSGWSLRPGISAKPITGPDPEDAALGRVSRGDNHLWLFSVGDGLIFHAGPSAQMSWITTSGNGAIASAGLRADDPYSINGQAVMYDVGKILKTGGAPAYQQAAATSKTYVIDINDAVADLNNPVVVRATAPMAFPRALANGVVLPSGQVLIVGGQTFAALFSDDRAVLIPELWDPVQETFSQMAPMQIPRVYHSTALLLPDARVFVAGGGLCGTCTANHENAEIFSPPYLFNADGTPAIRPNIQAAPTTALLGSTITVTTDAQNLTFEVLRMSAATHGVNNDQRRIPLATAPNSNNSYDLTISGDPGVVLPGYYMLFAINAQGTPSVARTIKIGW